MGMVFLGCHLLVGTTQPMGSAAPQGRMVWKWGPSPAAGQGGQADPGTGDIRDPHILTGMAVAQLCSLPQHWGLLWPLPRRS